MKNQNGNIIWLSHVLDSRTPLYGGSDGIRITPEKSMQAGDSCNTCHLSLPGHAGTHVDVPRHFLKTGKTLEDFSAESWIFEKPSILFVDAEPGRLLTKEDFPLPGSMDKETDILLFRTGFESNRENDLYWQKAPGLAPELADYLQSHFPALRAVGMDFISISSLVHREKGRLAHRSFLEKGIILFEDMSLKDLDVNTRMKKMIALPLRFSKGDGAPCTIMAWLDE